MDKNLGMSIPNYDAERDTDVGAYALSDKRWLILLQFALVLVSSAYMMMTFSAISLTTSYAFGVSDIIVNSCVLVFLIAFVVFNFISITVIEKFGLSKTVSKFYSNNSL